MRLKSRRSPLRTSVHSDFQATEFSDKSMLLQQLPISTSARDEVLRMTACGTFELCPTLEGNCHQRYLIIQNSNSASCFCPSSGFTSTTTLAKCATRANAVALSASTNCFAHPIHLDVQFSASPAYRPSRLRKPFPRHVSIQLNRIFYGTGTGRRNPGLLSHVAVSPIRSVKIL